MDLTRIIALLEACPGVGEAHTMAGRVAVAPTAQAAFDNTVRFPSVWVVSVSGTSGPNTVANTVRQRHGLDIGVLSIVRDLGDRTGAKASEAGAALRGQVMAALLGATPDTGYEPLEHRSDHLAEFIDGKLAWIDVFATAHCLRSQR